MIGRLIRTVDLQLFHAAVFMIQSFQLLLFRIRDDCKVKKWTRNKHAIMFQLSNKIVQVPQFRVFLKSASLTL